MSLQAAMQGRARQVRDARLEGVEAVVERQQRVPAECDHHGLLFRREDGGARLLGPMAASAVVVRLRHFWMVVGLTPKRLARALTLSCCSWIARRTACIVRAHPWRTWPITHPLQHGDQLYHHTLRLNRPVPRCFWAEWQASRRNPECARETRGCFSHGRRQPSPARRAIG